MYSKHFLGEKTKFIKQVGSQVSWIGLGWPTKNSAGRRLACFLFGPKNSSLGQVKTSGFKSGQQILAHFAMSSSKFFHFHHSCKRKGSTTLLALGINNNFSKGYNVHKENFKFIYLLVILYRWFVLCIVLKFELLKEMS